MSTSPRTRMSEAEYLRYDLEHEGKHEFVNGELVAMAGADLRHDRVVGNALLAIGTRLRGGPCRFHTADQRVRLDETGLYAYPDVTVSCGEMQIADTRPRTLLNPTLVVEVQSPSTAAWDAAKASHYRRRASMKAYVLVSIPDKRVELYERQDDDRWLLTTYTAEDVLPLAVIGIEVPLAELWDGLDGLPAD
jgi:Uma2 family endonuclease